MPYLLDGNNLIGRVRRTGRPADDDRRALVAELSDRLRASRARAVLFFDGPATGGAASLGPLSIRQSGPAGADDAILQAVESASAPVESIVVTADRGLAARVRDAGGRVMAPDEFFARFGRGGAGRKGEREGNAGRVDVEEWLRWLGDESNRDPD
jgi:hypothetical protein